VRPRLAHWLSRPATGATCRLLLGGVFVYTAVSKLTNPAEIAPLINGYRLLHPDLVNLAAITLPWVEFVAGALLILGIAPQSAALVVAGLLGLFIGAAFLALVRGLEISCGCFLPFVGSERLTWVLLPRDGVLLLLAMQVLVWPSSFLSDSRRGERRRGDKASGEADGRVFVGD